jgi:spore germination cell wall hydrolase CwlJ-like protein
MSLCLWREARAEPREGKEAIAFSILNRVAHPKWWGKSITSVVTAPWQFSSMTDPNDPQLTKWGGEDPAWPECIDVAMDVYDGSIPNPVPTADSYYAAWMDTKISPKTQKPMTPNWASATTTRFVKQVGNHKFFDTDGEHPDNVNPV